MEHIDLTRRGFVLAGGVAMAGLLVGCGAGAGFSSAVSGLAGEGADASAPPVTGNERVATLTLEDFDRMVGDPVQLSDGETTVEATILETVDHQELNDEAPELGSREPFSVVLEGPSDFGPREGRYELTHPDIGTVELFLCWMGPHEQTTIVGSTVATNRYELHFN